MFMDTLGYSDMDQKFLLSVILILFLFLSLLAQLSYQM